jgi:aminoglycoside phosphotransferase (APT) family kinase protein
VSADARVSAKEAGADVLDAARVAAFLDGCGLGSGPVSAQPIGEGHSNLTFRISRGDVELVLRRPPAGPLAPGAHNVVREARLQQALAGLGLPVARVLAVCEEPRALGAPFYLMEFVEGHVLTTSLPAELQASAAPEQIAWAVADTLADLHAVDPDAPELRGFGRPEEYLERQIRLFGDIWRRVATRRIPEVDRVAGWLQENRPRASARTLVHGDYRLGNLMLRAANGVSVAAVLDWEMGTLGDPLSDVGYLSAMWADGSDPENPMHQLATLTAAATFPTRTALVERYEARSGRALGWVRWYEVLATWKACVFLESSYSRHRSGNATDPYFATLRTGVPALARSALRLTVAHD